MNINTNHLCLKKECTGCYACVNRCPHNAIEMRIDKDGAIRPFIDSSLCVNCGLCDNVCPVKNEVNFNIPLHVYAAYANDDIRKKSASGGIATVLAVKFIKEGGVVYGAAQTSGLSVDHIRVDSVEGIDKIQGSKYVHSHLGDSLKKIYEDIKTGKKVLFIGTPCQVAAVKSYIKNKELLYCIDLICHGVPAKKTLNDCMIGESKLKSFADKSITFRDSDGFNIKIRDNNNKVLYQGNLKNSYYYNGFMEGYIYRNNCYECRYARSMRIGDITLGDFWGLNINKDFDGNIDDGINVTLVNTKKGVQLLDSIKSDVRLWERQLEEAVAGNGQLRHPSPNSINHRIFAILVCYLSAYHAVILCNIFKSIKLFTRKLILKKNLSKFIVHLFPGFKNKL